MHRISNEADVHSREVPYGISLGLYGILHGNIRKHVRTEYNISFLFAKHNYMYEARYSFR